ncbi:MAG: AMP-binding protein [Halobacteriales archaeon]
MDVPWSTIYEKYGVGKTLEYSDEPVHALLRDTADEHGEMALVQDGDETTYAEAWKMARCLAGALRGRGVERGDAVVSLLPTTVEFLVTSYAVSVAGATNVPVSPLENEETLVENLRKLSPEAVVAGAKYADLAEKLEEALGTGAVVAVGSDRSGFGDVGFDDAVAEAEPIEPVDIDAVEDVHTVLFTGGTTGTPKGCMLTHRNVAANAAQVEASMSRAASVMRGNAEVLNALPLYHAYGHSMAHAFVRIGVTQILVSDPRDTDAVVGYVDERDPTAVIGVPTQFMEMETDEGMDVVGISGSAPLASETRDEFEEDARGMTQGYGLSEMSPVTHFDIEGLVESIAGVSKRELNYDHPTVGVPVPETRVRIRDTETGDDIPLKEAAEEDVVGEMLLDGPQRMKGYVDADAAFDEGFVRTGDVVRLDPDGRFYVVDRVKNMINVSGLKVYTEEVDEELHAHPGVARGATVGVPDPERPGSERVKVFVETEDTDVTAEDVRSFLTDRVAKHAVPDEVEFVDEMPLTDIGKVDKSVLRDR